MEKLRCSPSSLGSDDDDWNGIYADSYNSSAWVYIGDTEELQVWQRPDSRGMIAKEITSFKKFT